MHYKLVQSKTFTGIQRDVKTELTKKWKPQGGISLVFVGIKNKPGSSGHGKEQWIYTQAMIKE